MKYLIISRDFPQPGVVNIRRRCGSHSQKGMVSLWNIYKVYDKIGTKHREDRGLNLTTVNSKGLELNENRRKSQTIYAISRLKPSKFTKKPGWALLTRIWSYAIIKTMQWTICMNERGMSDRPVE